MIMILISCLTKMCIKSHVVYMIFLYKQKIVRK